MIKQNKGKLILTSIAILIPVIIGLFLWNDLPDTIATHWGFNGQADGYSSKAFSKALGSIFHVLYSESIKTGTAFSYVIGFAVAAKVISLQKTISP